MEEGTTWWVMAADMPYGEFYDFYSISPQYFDMSSYSNKQTHKSQWM
jgi:hypothetical protein